MTINPAAIHRQRNDPPPRFCGGGSFVQFAVRNINALSVWKGNGDGCIAVSCRSAFSKDSVVVLAKCIKLTA